eukprot:8715725-Alexandrium_andersonii.AAC.1
MQPSLVGACPAPPLLQSVAHSTCPICKAARSVWADNAWRMRRGQSRRLWAISALSSLYHFPCRSIYPSTH